MEKVISGVKLIPIIFIWVAFNQEKAQELTNPEFLK
jgi:hypothetical protein